MFKLFIAALAVVLSIVFPAEATRLNIVSSIEPISYIVNDISKGSDYHLTTLIRGNSSPHDFHIKPSTATLIRNADVVFFIDQGFESFIKAPLNSPNYIMLARQAGMTLLPMRQDKVWGEHHSHGHSHSHENVVTPSGLSSDYHIWLSPKNAINMAKVIAHKLSERNPEAAKLYQSNLKRFTLQTEAAAKEVADELEPMKTKPYIVFHDAYQYFENYYSLNPVGAINIDPAHKPSAKAIKDIAFAARDAQAVCIFAEPQFPQALVNTIANQASLKTGVLNPLSVSGEAPSYPNLLRQLSKHLKTCLG